MKFKIERMYRNNLDGYDVKINIEKDGLSKLDFVNKISSCIDGFKDCCIYIYSNKIKLTFMWSIFALTNSNNYFYIFTIHNDEYQQIYKFEDFINKKDINVIMNYLARDIDEVIKEYKILKND